MNNVNRIIGGCRIRCLLVLAIVAVPGLIVHGQRTGDQSELVGRVEQFVRDKYGIPRRFPVRVEPFTESVNSKYLRTSVLIDDGDRPHPKTISVSKDAKRLIDSDMYPLEQDALESVSQVVRTLLKLSPDTAVTPSSLRTSGDDEGFLETQVAIKGRKIDQVRRYSVTDDKRFMVTGAIYSMRTAAQMLDLVDTASGMVTGPPSAQVTIVEFLDYQCPDCARMYTTLTDVVLPKYQGKVRVIYMDFPLPYHNWAEKASLGVRCVYQLSPRAVEGFQRRLFSAQKETTPENINSRLLEYAAEVGVPSSTLAACIASKSAAAALEADVRRSAKLELAVVPTLFINHLVLGGTQSAMDLSDAIGDALRGAVAP
jgi:protein-disulfide isomerase